MKEVKYLPIINQSDSCKVKVSDICYITRENRKLLFDTENGLKVTYGDIGTLEDYLGPDFLRCMSGCIINLAKVQEIKDGIVYFEDGSTLTLGRAGYLRAKQKFNAYLRALVPWDEPRRGEESKTKPGASTKPSSTARTSQSTAGASPKPGGAKE